MKEIVGAKATWPDGQSVEIFDLSYSGASMRKPDALLFEKGKRLSLRLEIAGYSFFSQPCELVRSDEKMVAVRFQKLDTVALKIFDEFLNDKLLGLHMALVNPKFYGENQTFKYWFHGPRDTNVFLWVDGEKLSQASIELDEQFLEWNGLKFKQKRVQSESASWESARGLNAPEFLEEVPVRPELLSRALKIFTQVQKPPPALWALLDLIKTAVKR